MSCEFVAVALVGSPVAVAALIVLAYFMSDRTSPPSPPSPTVDWLF